MYIDITGVDPIELVKAAYDLSSPVGLGFLHFKAGPLSDEDAGHIASTERGIRMDYVHGRCCKFNAYKRNGRTYIDARWYDHSDYDLQELLERIGVKDAPRVDKLPE